jgi:AbrB family looped-hinge helix DNA binding protein
MSSKGQIVIPEELRQAFGWNSGTAFIVVGRPNAIILHPVTMPDMAQFDELIAERRKQAKAAGLRVGHVAAAITRARLKNGGQEEHIERRGKRFTHNNKAFRI